MSQVTDALLSSSFGFALFDVWPDLSEELKSVQERMLYRALELASHGVGRTHPNPPVGAVVYKDSLVIAEGFHARAGLPHAEAKALSLAGEKARGAEISISLEPCTHHGRTPPCSEAVIASGVKKTLVGTSDPNPHVSGGGVKVLLDVGIDAGVTQNTFLHALAQNMITPFANAMLKKRPYVVMQAASSLDGRVSANAGEETAISSKAAMRLLHRLRDKVDAVAVGHGTVDIDNPRLTVREVPRNDERQPLRIVFDSSLSLPRDRHVFADKNCVVIHDAKVESEKIKALDDSGIRHVGVTHEDDGLSVTESLAKLFQMGITSLLVEGGPHLWTSFLNAGVVDEIWWFESPVIFGSAGTEALINLDGGAKAWRSPATHESFTLPVDRDHLTIMRIQKPL